MRFLLQAQKDSGKKIHAMCGKVHGKPKNHTEKRFNKAGDQRTQFKRCGTLSGLMEMTHRLWVTNGDGEQLSVGQNLRIKATPSAARFCPSGALFFSQLKKSPGGRGGGLQVRLFGALRPLIAPQE